MTGCFSHIGMTLKEHWLQGPIVSFLPISGIMSNLLLPLQNLAPYPFPTQTWTSLYLLITSSLPVKCDIKKEHYIVSTLVKVCQCDTNSIIEEEENAIEKLPLLIWGVHVCEGYCFLLVIVVTGPTQLLLSSQWRHPWNL